MKIVVLDMFTLTSGDIGWGDFEAVGDVTCYSDTPNELRAERIGDAEIVLLNRTPLDRETIERCPNLRYIGIFATGFNLVDIDAARERGVTVTNVPGYSTMAVTQHTLALLLELCSRVGSFDAEVKKNRWVMREGSCFWDHSLVELSGLTLGVIGYGGIGKAVADVALALGMRVLAYRRRMDAPPENPRVQYAGLDELLSGSDAVSLHAPLNAETKEIINAASLAKMKDGALLVNTARGALVVEADVAAALRSGRLGGYAADVTAVEPLPADSPLMTAPNCVITPHVAWAPLATRKRLFAQVAANLTAYLRGEAVNVVNP